MSNSRRRHQRARRTFTVWALWFVTALSFVRGGIAPARAEPWPAEITPVNIAPAGGGLPGTEEVSGAVWNPALRRLFVVDDNSGQITSMDENGNNKVSWNVGCNGDCDHEAITIADWYSQEVFVGVEQSPSGVNTRKVRMYDISGPTNAVLVQSWTLPEMSGATA